MKPPRTLIVSLGNPKPYLYTLHSAGHHALTSVQPLLGASQPQFTWQKLGKKKTFASLETQHLLAWSPVLMNVSGAWLSKAYRDLLASHVESDEAASKDEKAGKPVLNLLLVHDDLEEDFGVVKLRKWTSSHRGHNGVKSAKAHLRESDFPGAHWARISIGIGRPEGRDAKTVSKFVLGEMTNEQLGHLQNDSGKGVLSCLQEWDEYLQSGSLPSVFRNEGPKAADKAKSIDRTKSRETTESTDGAGVTADSKL